MNATHALLETVEAEKWTRLGDLRPFERLLIDAHLDKRSSTVEAGTGGGRILIAMLEMGFTGLSGFDLMPESIEAARRNDPSQRIAFEVHDATRHGYPDASFDQAVYLQQVICYPSELASQRAMVSEAYRILKPGGTALFSVLCFDGQKTSRFNSRLYRLYLAHTRLLRRLRESGRSLQSQSKAQINDRFNKGILFDTGPFMYWYRAQQIEDLLAQSGFVVEHVGSRQHVLDGRLKNSVKDLGGDLDSLLFLVVSKPSCT